MECAGQREEPEIVEEDQEMEGLEQYPSNPNLVKQRYHSEQYNIPAQQSHLQAAQGPQPSGQQERDIPAPETLGQCGGNISSPDQVGQMA